MEGLGFLYALLFFLYFISFLFTTLLVMHFLKTKVTAAIVAIIVVLAVLLSFLALNSEITYSISFGAILIYTVSVFILYLFLVGFSGNKTLPEHKEES